VTYPALDGLRALAVTLVFIDHFGGGSHGGRFLELFNRVRVFGAAGVSLFFVLSGFLITGILYDTRSAQHYFKNFYIRRSLRIFPIFYLVLMSCVFLTPILHFHLQWGHISFLFYLGNVFANWNWSLYELISPTHPAFSINLGHFWSLFVEEQFYLLWPVVVFLVRDRVKLIRLSVAVIVLVLLLRIGLVWFLPLATAQQFAFRMLPTRADDLLMGGTMALLLRGPSAGTWLKSARYFFLFGTGAFAMLALWRGCAGFNDPYNLTIGLTFVGVASAGLIALAVQETTTAFGLFAVRPMRTIGRYSYGFYIYHDLFLGVRTAFLLFCMAFFHSMLVGGLIYSVIGYLVVLFVAGLSYELYEKKFLAMKSRFQSLPSSRSEQRQL
jgi:peptidoglycan/LPS O-acetylase OafA/YrhL